MKKLQEIFPRNTIHQHLSPLLSSNFYFSPDNNPGLSSYRELLQEVHLIEDPLYLVRKYYLVEDIKKDSPIQITISLAWDGFDRAVDFLFGFTEALDLFFNPEKIIDTRTLGIGDFGVAWLWVSDEINVLAFIRNNMFVGIQGFIPKEQMILAAKSIDDDIKKAGTVNRYLEEKQGFIKKNLGNSSNLRIMTGDRLDIGIQNPGGETFFFLTSNGSMNRDFYNSNLWYYRAGNEIGGQKILLFRADEGLLPKMEVLNIEIIRDEDNVANTL
jgi:hypothetical protein